MNKKFNILAKILFSVIASVVVMVASLPVGALSADAIPYGTPKIDGAVDDIWNGSSNKIAVDWVNEGEDTGVTGYARLMWDEDFLYVLGYVNDSTVSTKVVDTTYWGTDSFEVFLDEENAHSSNKKDIAQFRVSRSAAFTGMLDENVCGEKEMLAEYKGAKWGAKKISSKEYAIELAIPWTRVSNVKKGNMVGIEFQVNDDKNNDGTTDSIINSEVNYRNLWTPQAYRMMTLTDVKADASSSESNNTSSTDNDTSSNQAPTSSTESDNKHTASTDSKDESTVSDTSSDTTSVEDTQSTDNTASDSDTQTVIVEEEDDSSTLIIVAIVVGAVVLIAAGVCVALLLKKPKK